MGGRLVTVTVHCSATGIGGGCGTGVAGFAALQPHISAADIIASVSFCILDSMRSPLLPRDDPDTKGAVRKDNRGNLSAVSRAALASSSVSPAGRRGEQAPRVADSPPGVYGSCHGALQADVVPR